MLVLGVDEVGRGCLAGPVVACACVLDDNFFSAEIKDSKKLSEKKRDSLYDYIISNCVDYSFGVICNEIIDSVNILNATKQAMHIAINGITSNYDKVVVDAVKLNNIKKPMEHPFKAEDKFLSVAAASILAKVYRDNLMKKLHIYYPEYLWYKNKGYGTKEHIDAIKKYGVTPLHRRSFLGEII
ncbi:ribonuclease HII [Deferribacteraceae bacterium V6Fe1]|nr:ribonuclease HII [Deferribacteraceae bacterium V6Fe1]